MMDDYIKREDAINEAIKAADEWDTGYITSRDDLIECYLNDIPAADVRKNVRGEWIDEKAWPGRFYCSCCNYGWPYMTGVPEDAATYNFCPNCGADMRGEDNEA